MKCGNIWYSLSLIYTVLSEPWCTCLSLAAFYPVLLICPQNFQKFHELIDFNRLQVHDNLFYMNSILHWCFKAICTLHWALGEVIIKKTFLHDVILWVTSQKAPGWYGFQLQKDAGSLNLGVPLRPLASYALAKHHRCPKSLSRRKL